MADRAQTMETGGIGERFFRRHAQELLQAGEHIVAFREAGSYKFEGADYLIAVYYTAVGGLIGNYGVEVKTVHSFVSRTNDDREESGTLTIDLYENADRKLKGGFVRMMSVSEHARRENAGTAGKLELKAKEETEGFFTQGDEKEAEYSKHGYKSVVPGLIIYLLLDGEDKPFAAVSIRDFERFSAIVIGNAAKRGIKINPSEEDVRKAVVVPDGVKLINGNMLHVPLKLFEDIVTVHIINRMPDICDVGREYYASDKRYKESAQIQQARIDYLRKLAAGKVIYDDETMGSR